MKETYCSDCWFHFEGEIRKAFDLSNQTFHEHSPNLLSEAIANENYELAAEIANQNNHETELPHSLFYTLSFHRNLKDSFFFNKENLHQNDLKKIKQTTNQLITQTTDSIKTELDTQDHITFSIFSPNSDNAIINKLQKHINYLDSKLGFAFSENFGFLGPSPLKSGHAYTLKVAIALPHLYYDIQIDKIVKSLAILGFKISPWLKGKNNSLIYIIENQDSFNRPLKACIKELSPLLHKLQKAEICAQQNLLRKKDSKLYNQLSSAYWSAGAAQDPNSEEILSLSEDLYCAAHFSYLSRNRPEIEKLLKKNAEILFIKQQLFEDKPQLNSPTDTFEKLLRTLQG